MRYALAFCVLSSAAMAQIVPLPTPQELADAKAICDQHMVLPPRPPIVPGVVRPPTMPKLQPAPGFEGCADIYAAIEASKPDVNAAHKSQLDAIHSRLPK